MLTRVILLSMAALVALTGCRSGSIGRAGLAGVALRSVGGFAEVDGATGPMDAALAARATTTSEPVLRRYLDRSGFQDGYSRVFRRGEEFVTVLVFELFAERNAQGLVELSLDELSRSAAYQPFTDPDVPQSRGWTLTSRVGGKARFCVGEWFWLAQRAFSVARCAPYVLSVPAVTGLAREQHELAVERAAVPS